MTEAPVGPAYRIVTQRLVLRCYEPGDAPRLKAAIDASIDHLLPWLPWARSEPQSVEVKLELLRQFRGKFDLGQDFIYGIFDRTEQELLGGCGLHTRAGPDAREIGYWIAAGQSGKGYATEATAALTRVGFEVEHLQRIEIHCDPSNLRSAAIPRKLGFRHDGTLRGRLPRADGSFADRMVWSLFKDEHAASPSAKVPIEAYDVLGRALLPQADGARRSGFR
jgi:RimJ/RimL family protein N-acetyltransferase